VVYDLERRVLLWVGDDRTEEAVRPFFSEEMGRRRCHTLQVICMDMWAPYAKLVKEYAPKARSCSTGSTSSSTSTKRWKKSGAVKCAGWRRRRWLQA
jgi:hypothetical protein